MEFQYQSDCEAAIRQRISSFTSIPEEMKPSFIGLASRFAEEIKIEKEKDDLQFHKPTDSEYPINCKIRWKEYDSYWVMKNQDLKLLETLAPNAIAIAAFETAASGSATSSPVVPIIGLLVTALTLLHRASRKSAEISDDHYNIIMALKRLGPSTPAALSSSLNGIHLFGSNMWTAERVEEMLRQLKDIHLKDGSIESFVGVGSDGLWTASDV